MKLKLYSMAIVFVMLLVGCNTGDQNDNNDNIEPTRYNDNNNNDMYNRDQGRGMTPGGTTNINNRNVNNKDDNQYDISKEAADKITDEIDEIENAYVLTTENNAYVAAVLDNDDNNNQTGGNMNGTGTRNINNDNNNDQLNRDEGAELTDEVKDKIADIVQSVDNDIDNVYVTTNPDFADLTNDYMNDFNDGKPVRGFFDQIGNMIERVFPQDKS